MPSQGSTPTLTYYAWNTSTGAYVTGDVANHTLKLVKDGTEASPTNAAAEIDATSMPGAYKVLLTSAETAFNAVTIGGKSSTSNVILIGITMGFEQLPTAAPGATGGVVIAGSNAATTFATLTSTGAFSINGTSDVAQTGDSYARIGAAGAGLTALGDTRIANLDTTVSSRMATYTQPTGFLAVTFPSGTVASTTNITAGTMTTTTNLTNPGPDTSGTTTLLGRLTSTRAGYLDNLSAGAVAQASTALSTATWTGARAGYLDNLSAGAVALASGVTVTTNNDKTGYTLTQTFPSNFSALVISTGGRVSTLQNAQKNTALPGYEFQMVDATTFLPKTGLTVTGMVSKDGGAFGALTNAISEISGGTYTVNLAAGDLNANVSNLQFTATGAAQANNVIITTP